uniref:integrase core domain-containing protein n=1 Tax=Serratia oryzae TaxID=2034155 RepID=UPI001F4F1653
YLAEQPDQRAITLRRKQLQLISARLLHYFNHTTRVRRSVTKELLAEWQHYYNWERPHSAHNGKTPMERYFELAEQTPYSDAVHANYQPSDEHIQEQNYRLELELRKLKRCL